MKNLRKKRNVQPGGMSFATNGQKSNMYAKAATWNPFKGCRFDCTYCEPSFKRQAKRQKENKKKTRGCDQCYRYVPHCHDDHRLKTIPSEPIIFACGNADVAFCPASFMRKIIERIKEHNKRSKPKTFYFQSKKPAYFEPFLDQFPDNVVLLTTLETNRDDGYEAISKAPPPSVRYEQFKKLDYPRKVVTVEPLMDFDLRTFFAWIRNLQPEYTWLGFNSKPKAVTLPEPSEKKAQKLVDRLLDAGIEIRGKTLRGVQLDRQ